MICAKVRGRRYDGRRSAGSRYLGQRGEKRLRFHPVFAVGFAEFVIRDQAPFAFPFAQRVEIHGPIILALHAHEPFVSHASLNRESVRKLGRSVRGTFDCHSERSEEPRARRSASQLMDALNDS